MCIGYITSPRRDKMLFTRKDIRSVLFKTKIESLFATAPKHKGVMCFSDIFCNHLLTISLFACAFDFGLSVLKGITVCKVFICEAVNVISERISDDIPLPMKSLNMVILILMH